MRVARAQRDEPLFHSRASLASDVLTSLAAKLPPEAKSEFLAVSWRREIFACDRNLATNAARGAVRKKRGGKTVAPAP